MQYKRGDIVLANNQNVSGNIQNGIRPYLIISNDKNNEFSNILTVIPLTTKEKKPLPTHYTIEIHGIRNTFLVEQITCISKDDVLDSFGASLSNNDMKIIEKRIKVQLDIKTENKTIEQVQEENDRIIQNQKQEIFEKYMQGGETYKTLAMKYGKSISSVSRIAKELKDKIVSEIKSFEEGA